jgi:hypothetical protein
MPHAVYILCALASLTCALLLIRGYRANRTSLLFWGAVCFVFITATNILLFIDLVIFPDTDLLVWRKAITLTGLTVFLYGLIFQSK